MNVTGTKNSSLKPPAPEAWNQGLVIVTSGVTIARDTASDPVPRRRGWVLAL